MGIIKNLKTHCRGLLVKHILKTIEENLVSPPTSALDISSAISILQAIQFTCDSWRKVSSFTIRHCSARFKTLIDLHVLRLIFIKHDVTQCVGKWGVIFKH